VSVVNITPEALSYMMERGVAATVDFEAIGGCCVPLFIPVVTVGRPRFPGSYQELSVPPASVFLDENALIEEGGAFITLTFEQALNRLEISGIYHRLVREGRLT